MIGAWTIEFEAQGFGYADDPEKVVGVITAIWNAGLADEFRHSGKINLGDEDAVAAFVDEAKAQLAKKTVPGMIKTKTDAIRARLNAP